MGEKSKAEKTKRSAPCGKFGDLDKGLHLASFSQRDGWNLGKDKIGGLENTKKVPQKRLCQSEKFVNQGKNRWGAVV